MSDTQNFFRNMISFEGFSNVFDKNFHYPVPDDWFVVIADVQGSTDAVKHGKYKEVNIVGASSIVAVLNEAGGIEVPYVFGGDGASFLIPPSLICRVSAALLDTKSMAKEVFGLDLRVGSVPVSDVLKEGVAIILSKYKVSDVINIAMFHGGGLTYAEKLVKADDVGAQYGLEKWAQGHTLKKADFSGLECRWNPIAATKDHIVTLMVTARQEYGVYNEVMKNIDSIYGHEDDYRPVKPRYMRLSLNAESLKQEHGLQTHKCNFFHRVGYALKMLFENILGTILLKFDLAAVGFEGKKYVEDVSVNTDFQKFDDTLRVILDSSKQQAEELQAYLDRQYEEGSLFYGINISSAVMMTCLIFKRTENHIHFVDGMAGGYTLAAKNMKEQISKTKVGLYTQKKAYNAAKPILQTKLN